MGWLREEVVNHGVDPAVRERLAEERLRAMMAIWTQDKAEFHGDSGGLRPDLRLAQAGDAALSALYLGGRPAIFRRIARLVAGWIAIGPSVDVLTGQLEELRAIAGSARTRDGHSRAGNRRRKVLRATFIWVWSESCWTCRPSPAQTLRRLDELETVIAQLA